MVTFEKTVEMKVAITISGKNYEADLSNSIDISLAVANITRAWYINPPQMQPVRLGEHWVGSVAEGGSVNFFDLNFNPHAHGTHTECLGHVTREKESVNQVLKRSWFVAELISVETTDIANGRIITATEIDKKWQYQGVDCLIIRTLPNNHEKTKANLSNSNWPYLDVEAAKLIRERGINHLLIDQPSVDKEEDGGALAAHKAFWHLPENPRQHATITELIFVPNNVQDGLYLLNLQTAPIENDATPSRPVLFELLQKK